MIVGFIFVGSVVGAVSALAVLMLGYSLWIAFCVYSAGGILSMLLGAAAMALRSDSENDAPPDHALSPPQHG